jgi:predicted phosphodiesterase
MRVAALYDVHGNVPALDAVLADVERAGVDLIVWGGDVAAGPMPRETIERMQAAGGRRVMGNTDRQMVEDFDAGRTSADTDDRVLRTMYWAVEQLDRAGRDYLAAFEPAVSLDVDGLGPTLFCHGSPRDDDERITRATPAERLAPMLAGVAERTVVCGHTHQQFDLRCGDHRVLNAGSVGMPYEGDAAAFWLLLGPGTELRRTAYDVPAAVAALRATGMPGVEDTILRRSLMEPADPDEMTRFLEPDG